MTCAATNQADGRWSDERIALLRKRWAERASGATIAAEFGAGISRNSVIAKIHRLGIPERPKPKPKPAPHQSPFQRRRTKTAQVASAPVLKSAPLPPVQDADIPLQQRVGSLLDLGSRQCHWPIGDLRRGGFFCGARTEQPGEKYCVVHRARAYEPRPRRATK